MVIIEQIGSIDLNMKRVPLGSVVHIGASDKFSVYQTTPDGDILAYLGPKLDTDRFMEVRNTKGGLKVDIDRKSKIIVTIRTVKDYQAKGDATKIAQKVESRSLSIDQQIAKAAATAVSHALDQSGYETLEDSNDFDIPEDTLPVSPYEYHDMVEMEIAETENEVRQENIRRKRRREHIAEQEQKSHIEDKRAELYESQNTQTGTKNQKTGKDTKKRE